MGQGDEVKDRSIVLADGRTVGWTEAGPTDGLPVLRVPGTPGSRWSIRADREPWLARNLRMITTERPGFGVSTRLEGRGFAEHADDLAQILDHLDVVKAHVIGGSGGSPHILAFCGRHPERVIATSILVGAAPIEDDEAERMVGLNRLAYRLYKEGRLDEIRAIVGPIRDQILADPLAAFREIMAEAPAADHAVMSDPGWQAGFERGLTEALAQGFDGWVDEGLAIDGDWSDVDPAAVLSSVTWYHAGDDANCPITAARRLVAQLPNARFVEWEAGGHLTGYHLEGEILDELLARRSSTSSIGS